jgi:long-chain acyl-CoA synthetase
VGRPSREAVILEALSLDPDVLTEIGNGIATVNAEFSHAEQIKRWRVLPRDLTLDSGELTPTLKMVRSVGGQKL